MRTSDGARINLMTPFGTDMTVDVEYVIAATGRIPHIETLSLENTSLPLGEQSVPENAGRFPMVCARRRSSPLGIVFFDPQIAMVGARFSELELNDIVIGEASFEDQERSRVLLQNRGLLRIYAEAQTG